MRSWRWGILHSRTFPRKEQECLEGGCCLKKERMKEVFSRICKWCHQWSMRMYKKVDIETNTSHPRWNTWDWLPEITTNKPDKRTSSVLMNMKGCPLPRTSEFLKPKGHLFWNKEEGPSSEFIGISYNTGMRPNEILQLKWSDVSINITDTRKIRKCPGYSRSEVKTQRLDGWGPWMDQWVEGWKGWRRLMKSWVSPVLQTNTSSRTSSQEEGDECPLSNIVFTKKLSQVLEETGLKKELDEVEDTSLFTPPDTSTHPEITEWIEYPSTLQTTWNFHHIHWPDLLPHSSRDKHREDYSGYVSTQNIRTGPGLRIYLYTTKQTPK